MNDDVKGPRQQHDQRNDEDAAGPSQPHASRHDLIGLGLADEVAGCHHGTADQRGEHPEQRREGGADREPQAGTHAPPARRTRGVRLPSDANRTHDPRQHDRSHDHVEPPGGNRSGHRRQERVDH
jgi:hypothetical protein